MGALRMLYTTLARFVTSEPSIPSQDLDWIKGKNVLEIFGLQGGKIYLPPPAMRHFTISVRWVSDLEVRPLQSMPCVKKMKRVLGNVSCGIQFLRFRPNFLDVTSIEA